jgi:hypothetical protein
LPKVLIKQVDIPVQRFVVERTWFNRIFFKVSVGTASKIAKPLSSKNASKAILVGVNTV